MRRECDTGNLLDPAVNRSNRHLPSFPTSRESAAVPFDRCDGAAPLRGDLGICVSFEPAEGDLLKFTVELAEEQANHAVAIANVGDRAIASREK